MGSADWMPRNLDKRVEITFPVEDQGLKSEVIDILKLQLADNVKAHFLLPNSREYEKRDLRGQEKIASQNEFRRIAMQKKPRVDEEIVKNIFEPATPSEDK